MSIGARPPADNREPAAGFLYKWRQRWPEWQLAEVFVAADQREPALAWFTLLQEWSDAAWGGRQPAPGLAKLAWWQEELRGWARGARRHPLGGVLQGRTALWVEMADAIGALRKRDLPCMPPVTVAAALDGFAATVAMAERTIFSSDEQAAPMAVIGPLLVERVAAEPAHLRAWLAAWSRRPFSGTRPRRLLAALARLRLHACDAGRVPPSSSRWTLLWHSWRAARGRGA